MFPSFRTALWIELMGATNAACSKLDCFVRSITVEMDLHKAR